MTEQELIQLIERFKLNNYRRGLLRFTRNTIFINPQQVADENEIPLGYSKLGGNPDLPADFEWPEYRGIPLTFMAQFRLSDLTIFDENHEMPSKGILYFFYLASEVVRGSDKDK